MTTSFIEKVGVWDPRMVQEDPTFLVQKGALSNTVMPFQAISANPSQHTYQMQVPNLGVFVDRQIRWQSGVYLTLNTYYAGPTAGAPGATPAVVFGPAYNGNQIAPIPNPPNMVWQTSVAVPGTAVNTYVGAPSTGTLSTGVWSSPLPSMLDPGSDMVLSMFPLSNLVSNMQVSINDANVTTNGDVLREMIQLANPTTVRKIRTTPSRWEKYQSCRADAGDGTALYPGAKNGNFRDYSYETDGDIPNGAWPVVFYHPGLEQSLPDFIQGQSYASIVAGAALPTPVLPQRYAPIQPGNPLVGSGLYKDKNGYYVRYIDGQPVWGYFESDMAIYGGVVPSTGTGDATTNVYYGLPSGQPINCGVGGGTTVPYTVILSYTVMEPIVVSPFLWRETLEMSSVGLFGCTNMQFTMNLQTPSSAAVAKTGTAGVAGSPYWKDLQVAYPNSGHVIKVSGVNTVISNVTIAGPGGSSTTPGFINPRIYAQFLTPAPGISVPLISSVPYTDFPRYFSNYGQALGAGGNTFQSQTITLSSCPDILLVWVKPNLIGSTTNIPYVPITAARVTFDNFSNLCSNFTQQHLYTCTQASGIDISWLESSGYGNLAGTGNASALVGCPLALRMGTDVTLSPGLAPGCLGNYSTQVTVDLDNSKGYFSVGGLFPATSFTMTIMPVSSGMFETCQGSSTIRRTILNTSDVISVTSTNSLTTAHLHRLVGGAMTTGNAMADGMVKKLINSHGGMPGPVSGFKRAIGMVSPSSAVSGYHQSMLG